jgi:hypothetical protein
MADKITGSNIKFWAPFTTTYELATYSLAMKSPELENKEAHARNQSIVRTRAGNTLVYDRGNDFNTKIQLEFRDVLDIERSALMVFLESIQWATTKVKYRDMYGDERIVRIICDNGVEYTDLGPNIKRERSSLRWNFNLDLLDLTNNIGDLESVDPVPSSALSLHLLDFDEPHNPEICTTVDAADGAVVLESFKTTDWRSIVWIVTAKKGTASATFAVSAIHNRADMSTVATAVEVTVDALVEQGTVTSAVTLAATISGSGIDQVMNLTADVSTDDWIICIRRTKHGAQSEMYP